MKGKAHRRIKRRRRESGAIQILEEAFHLVRTADVKSFWIYYIGAIPWSVGLLYFSADMSRSSHAARDAALAAVMMVLLWLWMRYCQAEFCASLWEQLHPGSRRGRSRGSRFRALAALWAAQALRLPALLVGLFFMVPLGWILAALTSLPALAFTTDPGDRPLRNLLGRALRNSHEQWAQNHSILLIFLFISLFTWINLVATAFLVPSLAKSFFGIESHFTLNPQAAAGNTTFLLGTLLLMQLAMVPLMLAAYVLRCFYAESRGTGADLLGRLAAAREQREREARSERGSLGRVAVVLLFLAGGAGPSVAAEIPPAATPPAESVGGALEMSESERFRSEIAETLEQKKYQWQLSRRLTEGEAPAEESWLGRRISEIADSVRATIRSLGERLEELIEEWIRRNERSGSRGGEIESEFLRKLGSTTSVALVAIILGVLLWMAFALYRRHRQRDRPESVSESSSAAIDLESEDLVATQLHEDEWLRLARDQIAKGDERLAIRALFLATLAHLGERGLLKIARFKSNRDYRSELLLRARPLAELRRAFDENTLLFERVWYGPHRPGSGSVEGYLANHGLIAAESDKAGSRQERVAVPG